MFNTSFQVSQLLQWSLLPVGAVAIALGGCNGHQESRKTIQECAALLPEGDLYMIEIRGVIDTGTRPPTIEGGFEVLSDGANAEELRPFSHCMRSVIQPEDEREPAINTSIQPD